MMKWIMKQISKMIDTVSIGRAVIMAILGLGGIIGITIFSILHVPIKGVAVTLSTLISCVLMTVVVSAFNFLVEKRARSEKVNEATAELQIEIEKQKAKYQAENERHNAALRDAENQNKIKAQEIEMAKKTEKIAKQEIEIKGLSDTVKLLENAQLSVQTFEQIFELALLKTELEQTKVTMERGDLKPVKNLLRKDIKGEYTQDEILIIQTHKIKAKFGVDFKKIKVSKIDEKSVVFSGIFPEPIATDSSTDTILDEVRTRKYKNELLDSVVSHHEKEDIMKAHQCSEKARKDFETKKIENLTFMNPAVIELAKNFIKVMFAPLYKNIMFDEIESPNALPIIDHLKKEIGKNNKQITEMRSANECLLPESENG